MGQKEFEQYAIKEGLTVYGDRAMEDSYDAHLDDCYGPVSIAGMSYDTSRALLLLDPTAYRCGFYDWLDSVRDTYTELDNGDYCFTDELEEYRDAWEAIEQRAKDEEN